MGKKFRIALTGATGLLGRNLMFEILKANIDRLDDLELIVLGRDKDDLDIKQRIEDIIFDDGFDYISIGPKNRSMLKDFCKNRITCLKIDLSCEKLDMNSDDFKILKHAPIDIFFHVAALTDFRDTPNVVTALQKTNVNGTKQVLHLVSAIKVEEFCYVGTAYACGKKAGIIKPDYIEDRQTFRNPYEKSKLEAELLVRGFAKKAGIRCRYFRPSTICGRLMERPLGAINKFDVFYSWAAFFVRLRKKYDNELTYANRINLDMRICYSSRSGLNIVPADYAAKIMYHACAGEDGGDSYYLVNESETPHVVYIPIMLDVINVARVRHAHAIPSDMNQMERLYYKTVGRVFTPYIMSDPMNFDTSNLSKTLSRLGSSCPPVDEKNFSILMSYAKQHNFGLNS